MSNNLMATGGYLLIGLVAGLASGCFGIGGGTIIVTALIFFLGTNYHIAIGTSLVLILPIALAGSITNISLGKVDWQIFWACAIGGVIGAVAGSLWIQKIDPIIAKRAFAIFLIYAAWKLW